MSTEVMERKQNAPAQTAHRERYLRPYYEVEAGEQAYQVHVYLPGVARDQADITLEKGTLTVEARRRAHAQEGWRPMYREIPDADYRLRLQLNVVVDEENITAKAEDGVLTVTLPVAEEAKPRKIEIT